MFKVIAIIYIHACVFNVCFIVGRIYYENKIYETSERRGERGEKMLAVSYTHLDVYKRQVK